MSYFEDASLVLIPSAQKLSKIYSVKPTDGTGDLTFTRSNDTATRVGPDGLIEKVRTNLILLQSNTFDTTWANTNTTETSGQTGYDGTNNAWFLTAASTSSAYIEQSIVFTGLSIYSIYLKKGTSDFAALTIEGINGGFSYFNLNTGALGSSTGVTASIQSIGNGWYRCSISASSTLDGSAVRVYVTDADNSTNVTNGNNILIQAAQLETGDIATDYIATTSAAVSVGPVANVPRLDYLGSSCPRLLLEPQRTNLVFYSEQLNNAGWAGSAVVTANTAVSPDGFTNADSVMDSATTDYQIIGDPVATTNGTAYTFSFFAKPNGRNFARVLFGNGSFPDNQSAYFNLLTGATSASAYATASMVSYGNGWEAGAYATSYIPTLGAAVTRGADAASKILHLLIGQTEGTLFFELNLNSLDSNKVIYETRNSSGTTSFTIRNFTVGFRAYNNIDAAYPLPTVYGSNNKYVLRVDGTSYSVFYASSGTPTKESASITTARNFGYFTFDGGTTNWLLA
jgi:hypothetical protein